MWGERERECLCVDGRRDAHHFTDFGKETKVSSSGAGGGLLSLRGHRDRSGFSVGLSVPFFFR